MNIADYWTGLDLDTSYCIMRQPDFCRLLRGLQEVRGHCDRAPFIGGRGERAMLKRNKWIKVKIFPPSCSSESLMVLVTNRVTLVGVVLRCAIIGY